VNQVIEQLQPAEFFRLFGVDTIMQGVVARFYEHACGRDPGHRGARILALLGHPENSSPELLV
jgi:hypothetical protein